MLRPFIFGLLFIIVKIISKAMINKYGEIGSPWHAPFSNSKYDAVLPPSTTQDSWLVNFFDPISEIK